MDKNSTQKLPTIDALHEALENDNRETAKIVIANLHPSEIADILESVPGKEREELWDLIDAELEGDVLAHMQDAVRAEFLEHMRPDEVIDATKDLEADDVADILQDLPEDIAGTILQSMDEQNRQRLSSILTYPENTAGGLMNVDVVAIRADVPLDVVTRYLRLLGEIPEKTDNIMVVDRDNKYLGVLPLTELLIRDLETKVSQWVEEEPYVYVETSTTEVAKTFEQRDLLSAAVVDDKGFLLGRITVDDVVDVIQKEAEQAVRSMAGLSDEEMFSPIIASTKRRAVWLGINLLTAFLGAWVIGRFEDTIQQLVALAVLMPVVAGMGGIAGSQTLTIAIRGIALGQIAKTNVKPLLIKELSIGILNGIFWSCVVAIVVILWFGKLSLGVIIGASMIINLIIAALAGATIPIILKRYGIDPAIAGGVILTTVTDVVGFVTFLGLATIFLLS
ncbi:MAG TPA: magnesium transporter [Gammaproteobacteria bacterium]|nr:magnesium transporter [Gammaproteobacteria bacterium]|tara:strand:- start:1821 stop:3170 length:1350 start_codon:yes stop_codon:yes gene_type:complete